MDTVMILLPIIVVAFGALITLATEPFLKDENKHKVLPWIASAFVLLGIGAYAFVNTGTAFGLYAMDSVRSMLGIAVLFCGFLGIAGMQWTLGHEKFKGGEAYALLMLATCGAALMTQAIDYLGLFLGMELASFPIYALVGIRRKDVNAGEGAFKYFVSGSIFSAIFLYGVALVYGATGSTHFGVKILEGREALFGIGTFLTVIGLLFKAGAAPVHFWVADVYTGASVAVTGFMAAVVKVGALAALASVWLGSLAAKAGVASWWNLSEPATFGPQNKALYYVVAIVAVVSMVYGAFGGLVQKSIRRIMAYSAVMNAGFIVIGLLLPSFLTEGKIQLNSMFYFLLTYAIGSAGALTGVAYLAGRDDRNENLDDIRGRGRKRPFVALGTAVCLASLAGLPPAAGFMAKFSLFSEALAGGFAWLAITAFALSLVAAVFYLRVAFALFAPAKCESEIKCCCAQSAPFSYLLKFAVGVAALVLVILGVFPGMVL